MYDIRNRMEMVRIRKKEYLELKRYKQIDRELLNDIAIGIKDFLKGKIKEI